MAKEHLSLTIQQIGIHGDAVSNNYLFFAFPNTPIPTITQTWLYILYISTAVLCREQESDADQGLSLLVVVYSYQTRQKQLITFRQRL